MSKYKVIVAEDEFLILKNLASIIEQECAEFEVISKVMTGWEAIECIDKYKPDILITDIRMPKGDGLEILKYIYENNLNVESIIISSFNEFNYAQRALQYGARDYLLKPVSPVQLRHSLDSIKIHLQQKANISSIFNIDLVLAGTINQLPANYPFFLLLLIHKGNFAFSPDENELISHNPDLHKQIGIITNGLLIENEEIWISAPQRSRFCYGLLGYSEEERGEIFTQKLYDFLNNLDPLQNRTDTNNVDLKIFPTSVLAGKVDRRISLKSLADTLLDYMRHRGIFGRSIYLTEGHYSSGTSVQELYNEGIINGEKLNNSLLSGNKANLKIILNDIICHWRDKNCPTETIMNIIKYQYLSASKKLNVMLRLNWENTFDSIFSVSFSWKQLYDKLLEIFLDLSISEQENINRAENMMKMIDEYLCNYYANHISNQTLSKKFGFVPSYISRLFREYKGLSPVEYLTKVRIDKAIELIKNVKNVNVYDISRAVGFSDPSYFARLFKQHTGMLPTEYRDQFLDKNDKPNSSISKPETQ